MYEPLEFVNSLNGAYTPFLATAHRFVSPKVLQFTIRAGVNWSDGKPFTPADVVFTFELLKKNPGLDSTGIWQQVKSVAAKGSTVTFTFKTADVPFAQQIASTLIVPQHVWASVSNPTTFTNPDPVVTGPYVARPVQPEPVHPEEEPGLLAGGEGRRPRARVPGTDGESDLAARALTRRLRLGDAVHPEHQGHVGLQGLGAQPLLVPAGRHDHDVPQPDQGAVQLDRRSARASRYALDRGEIATKAEDGYVQGASQSGLLLPNLKAWLDPSLPAQGDVSYNRSKASAAFAKAGYHLKGGKLTGPDGKQVSFSLMTGERLHRLAAGRTGDPAAAEAGRHPGQPRDAAVRRVLRFAAERQLRRRARRLRRDGSPYLDFNGLLSSKLTAPVGKPAASNFERWHSAQTDALLAQFRSTTSKAKQQQAAKAIQRVVYTQVPVVTLFYGASWGEYSTKSFTGWPSAAQPVRAADSLQRGAADGRDASEGGDLT